MDYGDSLGLERRMRLPWMVLCLLWGLTGCGLATRVIRLDTGHGSPIVHVPRSRGNTEPVGLDDNEVKKAVARLARPLRLSQPSQEAARRLFEVDSRSGSYFFDSRSRQLTPVGPEEHLASMPSEAETELTRAYLRWCERTRRSGDCLGLLKESPFITGDARFTLALSLAQGAVLDELWEAVKDMANPEALVQAALWTASTYALLWTVPEPATKGVAAVLTAALIAYVGVDTFWGLIQGFRHLLAESDRAATFDELRDAGERFGKVMGRNAARAFVMLATAAIGSTGATLGAKLHGLPGAARAAVRAEARAGMAYAAVGQVETVAMAEDGFAFALAPGAVAMSSRGTRATGTHQPPIRAWRSYSGFKNAMGSAGPGQQWHHVVEQTPGNVQRFGPEAIHNTENVIAIDKQLHERISAYYSSKQRIAGGKVVREWLREQSYEQQREFGLRILRQFGAIP